MALQRWKCFQQCTYIWKSRFMIHDQYFLSSRNFLQWCGNKFIGSLLQVTQLKLLFLRALQSLYVVKLLLKTYLSSNQSGQMNDNGQAVSISAFRFQIWALFKANQSRKGNVFFHPIFSNEAPVTLLLYLMSMNYWEVRSLVVVIRNYEYGIFGSYVIVVSWFMKLELLDSAPNSLGLSDNFWKWKL